MSTDNKPSKNEDEYFLRADAELIKAQRAQLDTDRKNAERKSHFMKCPKCGADLNEVEFHHVKVDTCPDCNGMWVDAGEIEMLLKVHESKLGNFMKSLIKGLPGK